MLKILTALRVFTVFAVLLGVIYPLAITGLSQFFMPEKANGSLIMQGDKVIGSALIGQRFTAPQYFHSRFSAVKYDAANSGASNLGPSNEMLLKTVAKRVRKVRATYHLSNNAAIPADVVLTSGSGLDPHISLANAMLQLPRVAKVRQISSEKIKQLIAHNTDPDFVGLWGQAGVNVLKLNLALDKISD